MMKKLHLLILIITTVLLSSCEKEKEIIEDEIEDTIEDTDYIVFGHFYNLCSGETCHEYFKLTEDKLYEDSLDNFFGNGPFDYVELSSEDFDLVIDIVNYFPSELLNEEAEYFGCPDCWDQGGFLIQHCENGILKTWKIDRQRDEVPEYLYDFLDKIDEKIDLLE